MSFPKKVDLLIIKVLVVKVLLCCRIERKTSSVEDKKSYSKGKNIHILTLVVLIQKYLRSHIARGAEKGRVYAARDDVAIFVVTLATFKTTCESKVGDFDVEIFVK